MRPEGTSRPPSSQYRPTTIFQRACGAEAAKRLPTRLLRRLIGRRAGSIRAVSDRRPCVSQSCCYREIGAAHLPSAKITLTRLELSPNPQSSLRDFASRVQPALNNNNVMGALLRLASESRDAKKKFPACKLCGLGDTSSGSRIEDRANSR